MERIRRPLRGLVIALAAAAAGGCNSGNSGAGASGQSMGASKDGVVATVDGAPISENLVNMLLKQRGDLGRAVDPESRRSFIDRLVAQQAVAQEAVRRGLDKSPEIAAQIEMSRMAVLSNAVIQDFAKSHPVSEDMVKEEYARMKSEGGGKQFHARHILLEQESEATEVIARLKKNPKEFESLARAKSKDSGSGARGGDLGWFDPRQMVPEFGAALATLPKGGLTEVPVKTRYGYHVIRLDDTRPVTVPPFEKIKEQLSQQVQQAQLTKYLDDLKAKAKVELQPAPGK